MEKFKSMLSVLKRVLWADRGACAVVGRTLVAACVLVFVVSHMGEMWDAKIASFGGLSAFAVVLAVGAYAWKCVGDIIALKGGDGKEEPDKPEAPVQAEPVKENTEKKPVTDIEAFVTGWDVGADAAKAAAELPFSCDLVEDIRSLDKKAEALGVGLHKAWHTDPAVLDKAFQENVLKKFGKAADVAIPEGAQVTLEMLACLYHSMHRMACCIDGRLKVVNAHRIQKADGTCCFVSEDLSSIYGELNAMFTIAVKMLKATRAALKAFGAPEGVVAKVATSSAFLEGDEAFRTATRVMKAVLDAHPIEEVRPEGGNVESVEEVEEEPVKELPPHPKKRDLNRPRKKYQDFGSWANNQD